jgi:hypothetical protein
MHIDDYFYHINGTRNHRGWPWEYMLWNGIGLLTIVSWHSHIFGAVCMGGMKMAGCYLTDNT